MRCNKAKILLSAYLDNEIRIKEKAKLEAHIKGCSSCREKLDELRSYSSLTTLLEKKKAPASVMENVMSAISKPADKNANIPLWKDKSKTVFRIAAAIAAILIGITLIPTDLIRTPVIKSDFYKESVKGGKGPSRGAEIITEKPDKKGVDEDGKPAMIKSLALKHNAVIKDVALLGKTNKISLIKLKISSEKYETFKIEYNSMQKENPLPGISRNKLKRKIKVLIGFPLNAHVAGDFNGDGYSDLITLSSGGIQKNDLFISENDSLGQFHPSKPINFKNYKKYNPLTTKIIAGDLNGDSFDDIVTFDRERTDTGEINIYQNRKGKRFRKSKSIYLKMPEFFTDRFTFLSGDFDGDGKDDLIFHIKIENEDGLWFCFLNKGNGVFEGAKSFTSGHTGWAGIKKYTPFVIDINGDGLSDTGIYGQSNEKDALWFISLNRGDGSFNAEDNLKFGNSSRAFQGDYLPFWGDLNADGLPDLLVKYGFPEQFTNWYKLINLGNFEFTLGQELRFGDKADFSIH